MGPVGASADGQYARLHAAGRERFLGHVDQLRVIADDLGHVAVLALDLHLHALAIELVVHKGCGTIELRELLLKGLGVVIAHDVARRGVRDGARDALQMEESLVALGVLGLLAGREQGMEAVEELAGVHHTALGITGMDGAAGKAHGGLGGVEAFPFELADGTAVHGVRVGAAKSIYVQELGAMADLFIGAEADAERGMRQGGVRCDARQERHDLCYPRLVVSAQQRGSV